jgi:hypothetical protein
MCHSKSSEGGERAGKKEERVDSRRKEVTDFLSAELPKQGSHAGR